MGEYFFISPSSGSAKFGFIELQKRRVANSNASLWVCLGVSVRAAPSVGNSAGSSYHELHLRIEALFKYYEGQPNSEDPQSIHSSRASNGSARDEEEEFEPVVIDSQHGLQH
ncbi:hypothetical protein PI125_g8756 [Phytophthora idaei]|nr:hypothetical protein PI125_g8756 [Phytophthora idaei]KAG3158058.1 hypothetical protein PI126_g8002 [Phytophthora idaei]